MPAEHCLLGLWVWVEDALQKPLIPSLLSEQQGWAAQSSGALWWQKGLRGLPCQSKKGWFLRNGNISFWQARNRMFPKFCNVFQVSERNISLQIHWSACTAHGSCLTEIQSLWRTYVSAIYLDEDKLLALAFLLWCLWGVWKLGGLQRCTLEGCWKPNDLFLHCNFHLKYSSWCCHPCIWVVGVLTLSFIIVPNKFFYVIIFMQTNFSFFPLCVLEINLRDKCRAIRTGYETGTSGVSVSRTQM